MPQTPARMMFNAARRWFGAKPVAADAPAARPAQAARTPGAKKMFAFSSQEASQTPVINPQYVSTWPWLNYDLDNLYPQRLQALLNSATHFAILQAKSRYTVGDGLIYDRELDPARTAWLDNLAGDYDVNELLRRTAFDLATYGGFCWQIILAADGYTIARVIHMDFPKMRIGNPANEDNFTYRYDDKIKQLQRIEGDKVNVFWLCADWRNFQNTYYHPVAVAAFDPKRIEHLRKTPYGEHHAAAAECPYILYYNSGSPIIDYYPTPDWLGAITDVKTEIEISNFHYHNVRNCFQPSILIAMPDEPSPEARQAIIEDLRKNFQGTDNANNILVAFGSTSADGGAQMPQLTAIPTTNNADTYAQTDASVQQKIITGHRLPSPTLAGLSGAGGLGGNASEIATAAELFMNTVIIGFQNQILRELKKLMALNGYATDDISLPTTPPVRREYSEDMLRSLCTRDELRLEAGFAPTAAPSLAASAIQAYQIVDKDTIMTDERRAMVGMPPLTREQLVNEMQILQALNEGIAPLAYTPPVGEVATPTDTTETNGL